jgi:hypothetical protein
MKALTHFMVGATCLWIGVSVQQAKAPLPPVYIQKASPARCDLIDRIEKRKGKVQL